MTNRKFRQNSVIFGQKGSGEFQNVPQTQIARLRLFVTLDEYQAFSQLCLPANADPIISFFLVLSFFFLYGTIFGLVLNLLALRFPSLASMTMLEIMQGVLGE